MTYIPRSNPFQNYPKFQSQLTPNQAADLIDQQTFVSPQAYQQQAATGATALDPRISPSASQSSRSQAPNEDAWVFQPPPSLFGRITDAVKDKFMTLFFEEEPPVNTGGNRPIGLSQLGRTTAFETTYPASVSGIIPGPALVSPDRWARLADSKSPLY